MDIPDLSHLTAEEQEQIMQVMNTLNNESIMSVHQPGISHRPLKSPVSMPLGGGHFI